LVVYAGVVIATAGLLVVVRPIRRLRITSRKRGLVVAGAGVLVAIAGLLAPPDESRVAVPKTRLDEFIPTWQFNEVHSIRIAAPPERVFEALRSVRAGEIFLFHTLTWIRRGGRSLPRTILDAGDQEPLIDVAVRGGFVRLADDPPREILLGAIVVRPSGARGLATPESFRPPLPPGFAFAGMNFLVTPDGAGGSIMTTETRVFATDASSRRAFAAYWRVIYPGSAIIRRSWLRAIRRRVRSQVASAMPAW
jgi:hypothetical protein